jgi:hypothetical protein
LLDEIVTHRREAPEAIVRQVLEKADQFGARPTDDRTLLVLRI